MEVAIEAANVGRPPTMNDVATKWTVDYRRDSEGLEWADLIGGKFLELPQKRLDELESKAYELARKEFDESSDT
jgi:hypothetical protein